MIRLELMMAGLRSTPMLALPAVVAMLTSCGTRSPIRAKAPTMADEQARCRAAVQSESPLVTEWSAAEKANLQARLRSGGLAVEYTGCSMHPITACHVRGGYRWQRTTLASDTINISNKDELFTKLPLGALSLEAELASAGQLRVRTMVSGQYVLEGASIDDVPDYGPCARATHLLTGISIGSFKMHSGGSVQGGGGVAVGEYGGGGRTRSSETVLRASGSFESCEASTEASPDIGCSSPIQAFLTPLPRFSKERGNGTLRATFTSSDAERVWELRSNQRFVCRTPCTRWINPAETYQLRTEGGPNFESIGLPNLRPYEGAGNIVVTAHPRNTGRFVGGIVTAGVGGGLAFIGGFLALMGTLAERDGLATAGGVTAGLGLIAVAPGVWLIASSGSEVDVTSDANWSAAADSPAADFPATVDFESTLNVKGTF